MYHCIIPGIIKNNFYFRSRFQMYIFLHNNFLFTFLDLLSSMWHGPLEILALLGAYSLRLHDFSPCSKATLIHYKKVINRHTCSFILLETHKQMKTNLSIMFSQGLSFDLPSLPPDMPRLALDLLQAVEADHSLTVLTQPTIKASTLQVNVQLLQVLCPHPISQSSYLTVSFFSMSCSCNRYC